MYRKIGTVLSTKIGNRVELIDYTDKKNSKEIGAFYLCPAILKSGRDILDLYLSQKVYDFMVDMYGEDISYTLDAEDF